MHPPPLILYTHTFFIVCISISFIALGGGRELCSREGAAAIYPAAFKGESGINTDDAIRKTLCCVGLVAFFNNVFKKDRILRGIEIFSWCLNYVILIYLCEY
jgi:hypothetical protein